MKSAVSCLVALAGLFSSSVGIASPETFDVSAFESMASQHRNAIGDIRVLDALKAKGRANATELIDEEDGEAMLYYSLDTAEWDEMYEQLVEESFGASPASPLLVRSLEMRQFEEEDWYFMCTQNQEKPWTYSNTMAFVAGGVCAGFGYATQFAGQLQIVERRLPDIRNEYVRAIFRFTWQYTKFATATACSNAIITAVQQFCSKVRDGEKGEHDATQGVDAAIVNQDIEDIEAKVVITTAHY